MKPPSAANRRRRDTPDDLGEAAFTALGASAHFDRVLYDGGEFGATAAVSFPVDAYGDNFAR